MVAVPRNQNISLGLGTARADTLTAQAPTQAWKRLSAGQGAKGPRLYDWARATLPTSDKHRGRWLLIRRSITDPDDLAFYLCAGPPQTTLETLVRVAGSRWGCRRPRHAETVEVQRKDAGLRYMKKVFPEINFIGALRHRECHIHR